MAAIPTPVLGGAGIALFGMITVSGIRTLTAVKWNETKALMVGVSISITLLPAISPNFYDSLPNDLAMIMESGITMGALSIIVLNLLLNRENNGHIDESLDDKNTAVLDPFQKVETDKQLEVEVQTMAGV